MTNVEYSISTYPSKFCGYQSKNGLDGQIKLFIGVIYKDSETFKEFLESIIGVTLLERICLERAFNKIRMKNRCKPICKMEKYALEMMKTVWNEIELSIYDETISINLKREDECKI